MKETFFDVQYCLCWYHCLIVFGILKRISGCHLAGYLFPSVNFELSAMLSIADCWPLLIAPGSNPRYGSSLRNISMISLNCSLTVALVTVCNSLLTPNIIVWCGVLSQTYVWTTAKYRMNENTDAKPEWFCLVNTPFSTPVHRCILFTPGQGNSCYSE